MKKINYRFIGYGLKKDIRRILSFIAALTLLCILVTAVFTRATWLLQLNRFDTEKYDNIVMSNSLRDEEKTLLNDDRYIGGFYRLGRYGEMGVIDKDVCDFIELPVIAGDWFNGDEPQIIADVNFQNKYKLGEYYDIPVPYDKTIKAKVIGYSETLISDYLEHYMMFLSNDGECLLALSSEDYKANIDNKYAAFYFFNMTQAEADAIHMSNGYSIRNIYINEIKSNENYTFLFTCLLLALIAVMLIVSATHSITSGAENLTRRAIWIAYGADFKSLYLLSIINISIIFIASTALSALLIGLMNIIFFALSFAAFGFATLITFTVCLIYAVSRLAQIRRTDACKIINN